jgi:hypothetical protein
MTTPPGYQFLIQLVDAKSIVGARAEILDMFGVGCALVAKILPGSEKADWVGGMRSASFWPRETGFTVFVPEGWRHAD